MAAPKAQISVEYLMITAFMLIIIVIIFAISLVTSDQNIKTRQTSESLDRLVQTADLIYAMGSNNVLYTEIIWPNSITEIKIEHKCKEATEMPGCPGGQGPSCGSTDCIKYSAISATTNLFGSSGSPLIYPSRAKLKINETTNSFLVTNVKYNVKVSWTNDGELVQLERA